MASIVFTSSIPCHRLATPKDIPYTRQRKIVFRSKRIPSMKYTFMQKNNKVMDVEMDPYYGDVEEILQVHDSRRIPLSVQYRDKRIKEKKAFQECLYN